MMAYIYKPQKKKQTDSAKQQKRRKIYNSKIWQDMRQSYLQNHPLCEVCEMEGKIKLAEHCHHLDSFVNYDGMEMMNKAYDSNNLCSVCADCHNRIHNGDLKGCKSKDAIKKKIEINTIKP